MNSQEQAPPVKQAKPVRWWPAGFILLLTAAALTWVWLRYGRSYQDKHIATVQVLFGSVVLLLLWVLFLSRFRWKVRLGIVGGFVGLIALSAGLFRIRGVTGDLLPVLEWRWDHGKRRDLTPIVSAPSPSVPASNHLSASYPQFLGPLRTGVVLGTKLDQDWKTHPPKPLWRQPVGAAWSGFAIVGDRAITQEQRDEEELVVCYELLTGKVLWSHADPVHYNTTIAGEGPRATPTVVEGCVYTMGAKGTLNCLDLADGKVRWSKDVLQENHSRLPDWGVSGSPLVLDDLVVVHGGGSENRSLVAYNKENGAFVWGGGTESMDYSSPTLVTLKGVRQILSFNPGSITSHDPRDGKVLWQYPWPRGNPHVTAPLVLPEDRVLLSTGYGVGSELISVTNNSGGWSASRVWKSNRLKSKFANLVCFENYIYGLDDGVIVCLDAKTGELKWKDGRYGHGQMILADRLILLMAEQGQVILLEPSPEGRRELTQLPVFESKTWNPPALAGEYLLVRNDKEAACWKLPVVH